MPIAVLIFLLLLPLSLLSGCAGTSVVDTEAYLDMAHHMPNEFLKRGLPVDAQSAERENSSQSIPYGKILFFQLSPDFMQERARTYYLGETFSKTLQPRRSTLKAGRHGFTIEHMTQRVTVKMLASCDWDDDGQVEWLVSCHVVERRGGKETTWYLLVPAPSSKEEILKGTPVALWECLGQSCQLITTGKKAPVRSEKDTLPPSEVEEFTPGEHSVTTPEVPASAPEGSVRERSL